MRKYEHLDDIDFVCIIDSRAVFDAKKPLTWCRAPFKVKPPFQVATLEINLDKLRAEKIPFEMTENGDLVIHESIPEMLSLFPAEIIDDEFVKTLKRMDWISPTRELYLTSVPNVGDLREKLRNVKEGKTEYITFDFNRYITRDEVSIADNLAMTFLDDVDDKFFENYDVEISTDPDVAENEIEYRLKVRAKTM